MSESVLACLTGRLMVEPVWMVGTHTGVSHVNIFDFREQLQCSRLTAPLLTITPAILMPQFNQILNRFLIV